MQSYNIEWTILGRGSEYKPGGSMCGLCKLEKYHIIMNPKAATHNKQNELLNIFIHRKHMLLQYVK